MTPAYQIRPMRLSELADILQWAATEGWNPGRHDAAIFYATDPNGFWVGELNGEIIAAASHVRYDAENSFAGLYIVKPAYRGQGYGLKLTEFLLASFDELNAGLDGVLENIALYQRIGFQYFFKNYRYATVAKPWPLIDPHIVPLATLEFATIARYDRQCFPAARDIFLEKWLQQPEATALGYWQEQQLRGYGVCRRCVDGYKIGPLFADTPLIADALFEALQQDKTGEMIYLDVPDINPRAIQLAKHHHMTEVFATARMYRHNLPAVNYQKIYGITTFELG